MEIKTPRLTIGNFTLQMAESVHKASIDDDNRRFMPDEVFDTTEIAKEVLSELIENYNSGESPLVYPILLNDCCHIGHIEAVEIDRGWELGYHIAKEHTKKGYASEAVKAFLPVIAEQLKIDKIYGICDADNLASRKVMEKCGFVLEFDGTGPYHGGEAHIRRYVYTF